MVHSFVFRHDRSLRGIHWRLDRPKLSHGNEAALFAADRSKCSTSRSAMIRAMAPVRVVHALAAVDAEGERRGLREAVPGGGTEIRRIAHGGTIGDVGET
jgi:hypothetical protein